MIRLLCFMILAAFTLMPQPSHAMPEWFNKLFAPKIIEDFPKGTLTLHKQDGTTKNITVEIANTQKAVQQGLMYRKKMEPDHGMIFLFPQERMLQFWMKNTYIPLDIIFIGGSGKIVHIHKNAKPLDETMIKTPLPAQYVLELNAGQSRNYNLKPGDKITLNTAQ